MAATLPVVVGSIVRASMSTARSPLLAALHVLPPSTLACKAADAIEKFACPAQMRWLTPLLVVAGFGWTARARMAADAGDAATGDQRVPVGFSLNMPAPVVDANNRGEAPLLQTR
ncbi:MAG: hypothetical protein IPP28_15965 [Xanthomonadales bacterium]|nr:hypothetical protein [Xanthomonadales bacterium]